MAEEKQKSRVRGPDDALTKLILGRQSKLEADKVRFNDRMQEAADYVAPHREDILGTRQPGEKKGTKIYDGTAQGAAVLAADGIHGYHVSPAFPWFKYVVNRKEVNQIHDVRAWLDEVEFNMYMALNRSNFYSEVWSYIFDGLTLGTPPLYAEEDLKSGRIVFESIHPGEAFVQENRFGEIDLLHRKRKLTARKMVQLFGKESLSEDVNNAYEKQPFTEFEVIHCVFPREEYDDRMKDAKNKRFASAWLVTTGNYIARESGFDQFPYFVWRYMRSGKEPYAITPAYLAMADIKGLNLMGKTLLAAAQLSVDPAYNIPDYLEGKVMLRPRGQNFLKKGDSITPVNAGDKYPLGIDREQAKQMAIKERFHVDTFLMLASLEGRGQRTAYEVSELMAEKAAVLGAELGPLNTELDHILDRVYDIEVAAGRMPSPPDILYEMAAKDPSLRFDPVYMGPLAQAQRERFSKDGIRKFLVEIAPLVQIQAAASGGSAEILDNFDMDEASRILADSNNVPAAMVRPKEARDKMRQARTDALRQANQDAQMQQGADMVKTISEADRNMGGKLTNGMQQMMGGNGAAV